MVFYEYCEISKKLSLKKICERLLLNIVMLNISQHAQENTFPGVSFLMSIVAPCYLRSLLNGVIALSSAFQALRAWCAQVLGMLHEMACLACFMKKCAWRTSKNWHAYVLDVLHEKACLACSKKLASFKFFCYLARLACSNV